MPKNQTPNDSLRLTVTASIEISGLSDATAEALAKAVTEALV